MQAGYTKEDVTRALSNIKHLHITEWYPIKKAVAQYIPTIEANDFPTLYSAITVLLVPTKVETTSHISEQDWCSVLSTVIRFGSRLNLMVEGNTFFYNAVKTIISHYIKTDGFLGRITSETTNPTNVFLILHAIDTLISIKPISVELDEFAIYTSTFDPFTFTPHEQTLIVPLLVRVVGYLLYSHTKVRPILSNEIMCYMVTRLLNLNNRMRDETVGLFELLFGNMTFTLNTDYNAIRDMLTALRLFIAGSPTYDLTMPRVLYALHHLRFSNNYPMIVEVYTYLYTVCKTHFMSQNWGYNSDQWMDTCYAASRLIHACKLTGVPTPPPCDLCNFMVHWADRIACGHCNYDIEEDLPVVPVPETQLQYAQGVFNSTRVTKTQTKGLVSYICRLYDRETSLTVPALSEIMSAIENAAGNMKIIKHWVKMANIILLEKIQHASESAEDISSCLPKLQSLSRLVDGEDRSKLVALMYYFEPSTWRDLLANDVIVSLPMHDTYARLFFTVVEKAVEEKHALETHLVHGYITNMRQYILPMDVRLLTRRITLLLKTI